MITITEAITRIPRWRSAAHVSIRRLGGGITNLSYRVDVDGESFAVLIAGAGTEVLGIERHRAYLCALAAAQTGVGAEVVHYLAADGVLVTRFIAGRPLTPRDVAQPEILARVVRSFHRYHAGPPFPGRFSPFRTLGEYRRTAEAQGAPLPGDLGWLYERAAAIEAAVRQRADLSRPCHNDLWESNLIDDGDAIRIIDWEYAGMGDVYFDLANFAIHNAFADSQDEALLRAYFGTVSESGAARLKLLKVVAELREAMWAMVAVRLPATAAAGFDCLGYAATHFGRCREALRDPRLPVWLRAVEPA